MYQAFPLNLLHKTEYRPDKKHLEFVFTFISTVLWVQI